jgi:hypothetical protein
MYITIGRSSRKIDRNEIELGVTRRSDSEPLQTMTNKQPTDSKGEGNDECVSSL